MDRELSNIPSSPLSATIVHKFNSTEENYRYIDTFFINIAHKLGYTDYKVGDLYYPIFNSILKKYIENVDKKKYVNVRDRVFTDTLKFNVSADRVEMICDSRICLIYNLVNFSDVDNEIFETFKNIIFASLIKSQDVMNCDYTNVIEYFKKYEHYWHIAMRSITTYFIINTTMPIDPGYCGGKNCYNFGYSDTFKSVFEYPQNKK
jgi:hypothetical protein